MAKKKRARRTAAANAYALIIEWVFEKYYQQNGENFAFSRTALHEAAVDLGIDVPKNLGDVIYSFRHRQDLPHSISKHATEGREWIIRGKGIAEYEFCLTKNSRIVPAEGRYQIKIPDATPEVISRYALDDEQALLAKVRYNRLVDIFLGVTAYSLQNHLRTTVPGIGQVETDEVYVGIRNTGEQFIIPVQAKGGSDQIGIVQVEQDLGLCKAKYPLLTPRLVAVQFQQGDDNVIVMFEMKIIKDDLVVADERHYRLVPHIDITDDDLKAMAALT